MMENKTYQMIALCQRAGKLVTGEFAAKKAVLDKKAFLVVVATDSSNNTKKLFKDKTSYRNISCNEWGTKEKLGSVLGKDARAVVAILDENFANRIKEMIETS